MVIGEMIRSWITELPINSAQKCMYSVIRFCVLAENVLIILMPQESWINDRIREFVRSPECRPYYDVTGKLLEFVWKIYAVKDDDPNPRLH